MCKAAAPLEPAALCGELVEEYTTPDGAACGVYCGTLDGDEVRVNFAERVQSVLRWYIEGYSAIDLDDERWRHFAVFESSPAAAGAPATHRLVAVATVFRFTRRGE